MATRRRRAVGAVSRCSTHRRPFPRSVIHPPSFTLPRRIPSPSPPTGHLAVSICLSSPRAIPPPCRSVGRSLARSSGIGAGGCAQPPPPPPPPPDHRFYSLPSSRRSNPHLSPPAPFNTILCSLLSIYTIIYIM